MLFPEKNLTTWSSAMRPRIKRAEGDGGPSASGHWQSGFVNFVINRAFLVDGPEAQIVLENLRSRGAVHPRQGPGLSILGLLQWPDDSLQDTGTAASCVEAFWSA